MRCHWADTGGKLTLKYLEGILSVLSERHGFGRPGYAGWLRSFISPKKRVSLASGSHLTHPVKIFRARQIQASKS